MRSLWLSQAMKDEKPVPPPEGELRTDVCIVGGGYTGLWTALHLKEIDPRVDVCVVEADVCGGGASGRNGGFVLSWWPKFSTLLKQIGPDEALRLCKASAEAVGAIGRFCIESGIDAQFHQDGYLWAATNAAQLDAWRYTLMDLERHGADPIIEMSRDDVASRTGSTVHIGGVLDPSGATVQPAMLVRGMMEQAVRRGVRVFEKTPMTSLSGTQAGPVVRTPSASIRARRVVLAMNAWAVRFAEIRRKVLVIGSDMVATEPLPELLEEIGWTDGLCISDSRLLVNYYRTTEDGRVAFGKGGGSLALGRALGRFEGPSRRRDEVTATFHAIYPSLASVPVTSSWTGPIDRSRTGLPFFGAMPSRPGVLFGVGYSGNGVGPSYLGGRILASLALELVDEWSTCGLVGIPRGAFPPEPFRFLGGGIVRAAIARKERSEDRGQHVDPLTRSLVRLAPSGLVPVKRP